MKSKTVISVIVVIIILFLARSIYSDHNLNRTVGACMVAQKQTNKLFDADKARKFCEEEIRKLKNK